MSLRSGGGEVWRFARMKKRKLVTSTQTVTRVAVEVATTVFDGMFLGAGGGETCVEHSSVYLRGGLKGVQRGGSDAGVVLNVFSYAFFSY